MVHRQTPVLSRFPKNSSSFSAEAILLALSFIEDYDSKEFVIFLMNYLDFQQYTVQVVEPSCT